MVDPFAKSAKYSFDPKGQQFFVILYPKGALQTQELVTKIDAFNNIDFPDNNLTVNKGNLDLTLQYIAVMTFGNKDDAMLYYETIISEENLINNFDPEQVRFYVISQENLSELTRTKDIKAYSEFFQQRYLQ
jgi:hypothetical protein